MIDSELLLQGYRLGVFPMAMEDDSVAWFSPDPRAIIPLESFHVPHALKRVARKQVFEIKIDNRFGEVIRACAKRKDTWINRDIIESYELGVNSYIVKPVDFEQFSETARQLGYYWLLVNKQPAEVS